MGLDTGQLTALFHPAYYCGACGTARRIGPGEFLRDRLTQNETPPCYVCGAPTELGGDHL